MSRMNVCTEEVNRISTLSDKLLCHVLALLSTKGAVATSVLSKRWQYVWTGVPVLRFTDYPKPTAVTPFDQAQYFQYKNFVNRVLFLNIASCLERVDLECDDGFSPSNVYEWMLVLSNKSVKELRLVTSLQSFIKLPSTLLLHKDNLVNLELCGKLELCLPTSIHLPRLTRLSFTRVQFRDADDPFSIILPGSPALKVLTADFCQGFNKITACSSSLSVLKIVSISSEAQSITIKTPKLQHLHLSMSIDQSSISELPSLVTAILEVTTSAVRWVEILQRCCTVQTLEVRRLILDRWNTMNRMVKFYRLKKLLVYTTPWSSVLLLLRFAPNLATLIIGWLTFDTPSSVPKIVELALERIEFHSIDIREEHLEVLRILLSCYKLLNELEINVKRWKSRKSEIQTLKRLLELPRGSATCRISVVSGDDYDDD